MSKKTYKQGLTRALRRALNRNTDLTKLSGLRAARFGWGSGMAAYLAKDNRRTRTNE